MLRPFHSRERHSRLPSTRKPRKTSIFLGSFIVFSFGLIATRYDLRQFVGRDLLVQCIHNMYAEDVQSALDMPKPPVVAVATEVPASMALCKEWVRRLAEGNVEPTYTQEDDSVCMDWAAPHYRVMEIISSSILDRVNDFSRYRHDCFRSRTWDEGVTGYDRTTIQQMLPVAKMGPNQSLMNNTEFLNQCKVCLHQFNAENELSRHKTFASHHCFAWPETWETHDWAVEIDEYGGLRGDKIVLPHNGSKPNTVPLTSVFPQIRNRLQNAAKVFSNVTMAPPDERDSGVIIWLDASTTGIPKEVYPDYFPSRTTSITILSSPLCASAYLPTGQKCYEYAESLVTYFQGTNPELTNTGYNGLNGIKFQMSTSSAGSWSRMIRTKVLICPPTSPNCLIPAASKDFNLAEGIETHAFVLDIPSSQKAIEFFNLIGHADRVTVEQLWVADVPTVVSKPENITAPKTSTGEEPAPELIEVNDEVNDEGYPSGNEPQEALTQSAAEATAPAVIISAVAPQLPSNTNNENVYFPELEVPVTQSDIDDALAKNETINKNYSVRGTTKKATEEMAVDEEAGLSTRPYSPTVEGEQLPLRIASQERIREMAKDSKVEQGLEASPNQEIEIFCPRVNDEGYEVNYHGGTVEIIKNDEVVVSDGSGTAVFKKNDISKQTIPVTRDSEGNPYTKIYDAEGDENITVTGRDILINNSTTGIVRRDSTGILMIDNTTGNITGSLVTEGSTGNLETKRDGDMQIEYSGTIVSTGQNRVDKGDVVRHGRGYAVQINEPPGYRRTIYGWWNGFYSSKSASSSESGGSGYQGTYAHHDRPAEGYSSSDENGVTSDSRDMGREIEDGLLLNSTSRRLKNVVAIKVSANEIRRFGEKRVCQNHRVQKAQGEEQLFNGGIVGKEEGERIIIDPAPERRQLSTN